jgi:hypothetical protein
MHMIACNPSNNIFCIIYIYCDGIADTISHTKCENNLNIQDIQVFDLESSFAFDYIFDYA